MDWKSVFNTALQQNPNVLTVFITALLLPALVLILNNRQARKLKQLDADSEKEKEFREEKQSLIRLRKDKESFVYGVLLQILFCVQSLHAKLSVSGASGVSILENSAIEEIEKLLTVKQKDISEAQAFIRPELIPLVYQTYANVTSLQLELRFLQVNNQSEVLLPCLSRFIGEIGESVTQFHVSLLGDMRDETLQASRAIVQCCGRAPTKEEVEKYQEIRGRMEFVCLVPAGRTHLAAALAEAHRLQNPIGSLVTDSSQLA